MRRLPRDLFFVFIVLLVFTLSITAALPASAQNQTFSNPTSIAIPFDDGVIPPETIGLADLYPSTINVSGMLGNITDVNVTLSGFSHTFTSDVDVLLVGPGDQNVLLMADAGCTNDASGLTLTFDQSASGFLSETTTIAGGTYLPTNYDTLIGGCGIPGEPFLAPAPAGPYGTSLDIFNGTNPNGAWSLYVLDDSGGDAGSLSGGWSLEITTATAPTITSPVSAGGVVGTPFSHTFTATGDPAPTLSYSAENLPPGVSRVGDVLIGTPTAVGNYGLTVTASNGVTPDAVQNFTLTVTGGAPTITSLPVAIGTTGVPFTHTFTAVGNPAPTFSYANENLPPGIIRSGDTLMGTPTTAGTYTIDATASNGVTPNAFQTLVITVIDIPLPPPPPSLPPVVVVPPVPTCNTVGNDSSVVVRAQAADGTVTGGDVFCRILNENGTFAGNSGQVGNSQLIAWGVLQAVDVFGLTTAGNPVVPFNHPVYVCLRGTGTLYYADASNAPRTYVELAGTVVDDFTCASLPNAGTLVLVRSSGEN